jgi:hypothetical protein
MPWPLVPNAISMVPETLATGLTERVHAWLNGCSGEGFPYEGTVAQSRMLRTALETGELPPTLEGIATWLAYNGSVTRPPVVLQAWMEAYTSAESQMEQRVTEGGKKPSSSSLFHYLSYESLRPMIRSGRKDCWLASKGWSRDEGIRFAEQQMAHFAAVLPANTFVPGTEPLLYVPGTLPAVPVYDDPSKGDFQTGVTTSGGMGSPSSISRPDDRWYYPDGTIRNAQGVIVGTYDVEGGNVAVAQMLTDQPANLAGTGLYLWSDGSVRFKDGEVANNALAAPGPTEEGALPYRSDQTVATAGHHMPTVIVEKPAGSVAASQSSDPGGTYQVASSPTPAAQPVPVDTPAQGITAQLSGSMWGVPVWALLLGGLALAWTLNKRGR